MSINCSDDKVRLQKDFNPVAEWCQKNGLESNEKNRFSITFSKRNTFDLTCINNSVLNRFDHIKDLGVICYAKLSFNQYIDHIRTKALLRTYIS